MRGRDPERIIAVPGCMDIGGRGMGGYLFFVIHVPGGGAFWTNRAEAHGQLVLSPMRLPEQLRSSRGVHQVANVAQILIGGVLVSIVLLKHIVFHNYSFHLLKDYYDGIHKEK